MNIIRNFRSNKNKLIIFASVCFVFSMLQNLNAQAIEEGGVLSINTIFPDSFQGDQIFRKNISTDGGADFVRLHFSGISDGTSEDYQIIIRDYKDQQVFAYSKKYFSGQKEFWTGIIFGGEANVEVLGLKKPLKLQFKIDGFNYQHPSGEVLSIVGPDNREPIHLYDQNADISSKAKSVSKLSFIKNGRSYMCTGFMISDNLLLTNEHCVNSSIVCKNTVAIFNYREMADESVKSGVQVKCEEFIDANYELDYALLKLEGSPGSDSEWGKLVISSVNPNDNEDLIMIQHPNGEPKQISKEGCKIDTPLAQGRGFKTDFGHLCDTLGGSSGSPILNNNFEVIGLHHFGFSKMGFWSDKNRAVRMNRIYSEIEQYISK